MCRICFDKDEVDIVKGAGNQGRGKDISTIVNAEKEEQDLFEKQNLPEELPPVVPVEKDIVFEKEPKSGGNSDDEPVVLNRKLAGRKKPRKLNSLDVNSEEDGDSDEDFKGDR